MDDIVASCAADLRALCPGATDEALTDVAQDLVTRWTEPHRRYHGLRHLAEILAALGRLSVGGELTDDALVLCRVAAWYHDAVFTGDGAPGPDEEASGVLAVDTLDRLGADLAVIERVGALVAATVGHEAGSDPAAPAFLDADLWILGAPEQRFDDYCLQVREEFPSVSDADYRAGRRQILEHLVDREHVYATETARAAWEAQARANVARELARLGA